jgi:hypothetical protein
MHALVSSLSAGALLPPAAVLSGVFLLVLHG